MTQSTPETRFAVLFFTDIVGSTDLKARHGVPAYSAALQIHNDHFERIVRECRGIRILQNMGDGYFAEAGGVAEAVRFALLFQDAMRVASGEEIQLTTRVGIHAGEVTALVTEGGSGIVAPAADLAARVMSLAVGGQILLTRFPFDEARHFLREHPAVPGRPTPPLRWLAHGPYLLKGRDEPMEIFEVGAEGFAPLTPPPDSEKAKRAIRPGEEETLGWRPAIGLEIPGRPGWKLIGQLGTGGFGEVWTGEHAKLHQRRAFKFCFDDERLRALKREVTLVRLLRTALGDRDDIVRFHELKLDEPPFYLESDLAPHGNLLQWAEKQGGLAALPLAQRISLVAHTATALAAAHSIGVLHKDIKPTNILIFDTPDGSVRPRLVDFGIGTLADPAVLGQHGVTSAGFTRASTMHSTGTPTYSPPEYLAGKPYTVQGDIYGLGVLLYQLITTDSTRPIAPGWERDVADPLLREDIAACVDGDSARRLPSAADLADRLFHLDQRRAEIVEKERLTREATARAESEATAAADRIRATRLRKLAGAFAMLTLLAIAGGLFAWANQRKADTARAEIVQQKTEVERKNTEFRAMLVMAASSDRSVAEDQLRIGQEQEAFAHLARACEYDPSSTLAAEKAFVAVGNWNHLQPSLILDSLQGGIITNQFGETSAQFSADGTRILAVLDGKTPQLWDATTGKMLVAFDGSTSHPQFSPDGKRILIQLDDKTALVCDAATGQTVATLPSVIGAEFSPDSRLIASTGYENTVRIWEAVTGKLLATLAGHQTNVLITEFSSDGTRIVTKATDKTARLWETATGQTLASFVGANSAEFSHDSTRLVTALNDNTACVWEAATGKLLTTLAGHQTNVLSAEFSSNTTRIVTTAADRTARVWGVVTSKTLMSFNRVKTATFSPDGTRLIITSDDSTALVWDVATGKTLATFDRNNNAELSPDSTLIATTAEHEPVHIWDTTTGKMLMTLGEPNETEIDVKFSPDSKFIVISSPFKPARLWDVETGKVLASLGGHKFGVFTAEFSPNGARIVTMSWDRTAVIWDTPTGKTPETLAGYSNQVNSAQFSPDSTRIVTASKDNTARIWDAASGKELIILAGHSNELTSAQFSPDGTRIVTASEDNTARVWDSATGKTLATLAGHEREVRSAQFSPDGTRIVTASEDKTARVWDASSGRTLAILTGNDGYVTSAQFSPDGTRIVTASNDNTARVWDATSGKLVATLVGHERDVYSAQFSPDGTRIATASEDDTARIWDAATGKMLATLAKSYQGGVACAQFSPDGRRIITAGWDLDVHMWDAVTGKLLMTLTGGKNVVFGARFNAEGTRIVTAGAWENNGRLWDAATGKILATLTGFDGSVHSAQFSPDGTRIVTTSSDGIARVCDALPPRAGAPPEWFPDFLRYMAQMRLNSDGELETLKPADWLALRERLRGLLRGNASADTPYLRILRKYVRQ